jgi:hypothetical protein
VRPKEPFYFVREKNWNLGEKWYLSLFADATHHTIIGKSTTDYKKPHYDGVPERIRDFNPGEALHLHHARSGKKNHQPLLA